jgi:hypothetical protein
MATELEQIQSLLDEFRRLVPKLLITRFTHGAAGKFLSTILQTSNNVHHWNQHLQNIKKTDLWNTAISEYVYKVFPKNHCLHLQNEPMVPYNTDLYSTSYKRGNSVTLAEFIQNAIYKQDSYLMEAIEKNFHINLIFNKPNLPEFCFGSSVVTITVESQRELNWLERTLWSKHFLETKKKIFYLPNHPDYCHKVSLQKVLLYNNQYKFPIEEKTNIIQSMIKNNPTRPWYLNKNNFIEHDTASELQNIFIPLSAFFEEEVFLNNVEKIFDYFQLENFQPELIRHLHLIWLSRQLIF